MAQCFEPFFLTMSNHLVIIDALNLIRRIHAAQSNSNDIQQTSLNCVRALNKIILSSNPTHIVAVFDFQGDDRGWRAQILPSYKQDRSPMPFELSQGLDQIQEAFMQIGVDSLLSDGDEADDIVASLAYKMANQNQLVTIVSTDKGYCQLLQPTLRIRDYFQQRWLDSPFIQTHFGVLPEQLTDFWGLAGISSSNIQGVPGIGTKSAALLLNKYKNLEDLFNAEDLDAKWQKKLVGNQEMAMKCKQIATLKIDIALGFNLKDIRYKTLTAS